eukprot:Colp12_sorted_trinity150504_noHs@31378
MASLSRRVLVAVGQMTSTSDIVKNLNLCKQLVAAAKQQGCEMLFLPEAFDYIGTSKAETLSLAENLDGPLLSSYKEVAKEAKIWLSLGGFHEKPSADSAKIFNTHVVLNSSGSIAGLYRKIHLFDVDLKTIRLCESETTLPGTSISEPVETPAGKVGLSVCYDMRFPEVAQRLRAKGADILTYPSAFTEKTGAAHWEILLRARAIESQCYVIAAAQVGKHNERRSSYGHACIIDPWGTVVAQCSEQSPCIATATIDLDYLNTVRENMPVFKHRREDIYNKST